MLVAGLENKLEHFTVDMESLSSAAQVVSELIRVNYPDGKVPFHARWRHFVVGARDLWAERARQATWSSPAARARAEFDLAITSVLLDAGAGASWHYLDVATEQVVSRSEGSRVASLRMFEAGAFSSDPADPLRADAERLTHLNHEEVADGFQSMVGNPAGRRRGTRRTAGESGQGPSRQTRRCSRARPRAVRVACTTISPRIRRRKATRPAHSRRVAPTSRGDLAEPAHAWRRAARRHLAPSGDQARRSRPTASCRSTSSRSGSPIR
jgi:hypothetical protein